MTDWETQGNMLQDLLALRLPAIGMAFLDSPPEGVAHEDRPAAAGCAFWKRAAEGSVFYTVPSDHFGCTIGSHTHGVELPDEKKREFVEVANTMVQLEYLKQEELPAIPHRPESFGAAVYGPLQKLPVAPQLILVRGTARQIMLLAEAARSAGATREGEVMGRPACAMIPQTLNTRRGAMSLGCIGNRVYTGLGDNEFYFSLPGVHAEAVTARLAAILHANRELEKFHQARQAALQ